jgi:peptide/nickel transport system substrate-binding protein
MTFRILYETFSILLLTSLFSCSSNITQKNKVNICVYSFPTSINYLTTSSAVGNQIQKKTFNKLLKNDSDLRRKPLAAKDLPQVTSNDSLVFLKYELRQEAKWDDGSQMTSKDILFSLKAFKLPLKSNLLASIYYARIKGIEIDSTNEKVFTLFGVGNKEALFGLTGDFGILQKSIFDPKGMLDHITLDDISNTPEKIERDSLAIQFIDNFTRDPFKYNEEYFSASGPYKISEIKDGQFISLIKNENWWGHSVAANYDFINANPDKITYYSIPESLLAIQSLKKGDIDIMSNVPASEFISLENNMEFKNNYILAAPTEFSFSYIGVNSKKGWLKNKLVRKALAYLINKKEIVESLEMGFASTTVGPINPILSYYYNNKIGPYDYNPEFSEKLLAESGLIKRDDEWYQQNSEKPLELSMSYRLNSEGEGLSQILQAEAKKIGLKIKLEAFDGRTLFKKLTSGDFDLYVHALAGSPYSFNFAEIYGVAASQKGGMNLTGFGNAKSDSLIQAVNFAIDSTGRRDALFGLQEMLHDEATMLFLYFSQNKMAISKKFTNLKISSMKPGYDVTAFKLTEELE